MVGLPSKLGHQDTIYVVSQVPISECDEVLQGAPASPMAWSNSSLRCDLAITATKHSFHDSDTVPWLAENRYYSARLQFKLIESLDDLLENENRDVDAEIPALALVIDAGNVRDAYYASLIFAEDIGQAVDATTLSSLSAQSIDVPLVVGRGTANDGELSERNREVCFEQGFEYIDVNEVAQREVGGRYHLFYRTLVLMSRFQVKADFNGLRKRCRFTYGQMPK